MRQKIVTSGATQGQRVFRFIVDCESGHCKNARKLMDDVDFLVERIGRKTLLGDHFGYKEFKTMKQAKSAARELMDAFNDNQIKVHSITVDPHFGDAT